MDRQQMNDRMLDLDTEVLTCLELARNASYRLSGFLRQIDTHAADVVAVASAVQAYVALSQACRAEADSLQEVIAALD